MRDMRPSNIDISFVSQTAMVELEFRDLIVLKEQLQFITIEADE